MDMDDISSTPVHAPEFSLMNDKEKTDWVLHAANKVVETSAFCDFGTINHLRENLRALDRNDSQMEAMKNEDFTSVFFVLKHTTNLVGLRNI